MKCINTVIIILILSALSLHGVGNVVDPEKSNISNKPNQNTLWYTKPAQQWIEALPIGNGRLGGMVFGGVENELLQLNEESVWAGPPVPEGRAGAWKSIDQARKLIFMGKYTEAGQLVQKNVMSERIPTRSYQTLGDLKMKFRLKGEAGNYKRELDIDKAIAKTTFTLDGVTYTREFFSTPEDQVIVVVLTADQPESITVDLSMERPVDFEIATIGKNKIRMWGQAGHDGDQLGVNYETQILALPKGGKIATEGGNIKITKANSVTLFIAAATDYNRKDPYAPLAHNLSDRCSKQLKAASKKSVNKIVSEHITEHQRLFGRVEIDLGTTAAETKPTDERLKAVKQGADDPGLIALYFQYGRYLLITSSRAGTLPANLQGIWNNHVKAPWNSDYHTNINLQMNYWLAEVTNLSECHEPFFTFIEALVSPGQKTAEEVYNCDGFVVHHTTDVWHWSAPIGRVGYGMWPLGGAWSTQHFMEHYRFTGNKTFLAERAYPIMKESCKFLLDWLSIDPRSGKLVSGPSTSPENRFYPPDQDDKKNWVNLDMGNAMDQEIIWDNFTNLLEAAKVLEIQDDFISQVASAIDNLVLPKIGSDGRLMEWSQEFTEVDAGHRHMSHLYGLYPGRQFSESKTPYMIDAINRSINYRLANGGGHTGWSRAWIINFYARLQEPEKAYQNVKALLQKSTSHNLFDFHPPFQIDGNFGATAGIAEMLIQSHMQDEAGNPIIHLLPTLPSVWPSGSFKGLCARGGFVVDIEWDEGELKSGTISSRTGGTCKIRLQDEVFDLTLIAGEKKELTEF